MPVKNNPDNNVDTNTSINDDINDEEACSTEEQDMLEDTQELEKPEEDIGKRSTNCVLPKVSRSVNWRD